MKRRGFIKSMMASAIAAQGLHAASLQDPTVDSRTHSEEVAARCQSARLNYHPSGMYVWDSWYFTRNEEVHVIHLQKRRPGSNRAERDGNALGHAVSTDLLTWNELPIALFPGSVGAVDDLDLFTGCTHQLEGTYYLFYTARKRSENGQVQRICLATSSDTIHWRKHGMPVIEPDNRWYECGDCRDIMVVRDDKSGVFHGFFTARIAAKELIETAVVAHATSYDLVHWEQGPPVFAPAGFGILEEPDVFFLDGRWWMICATGNFDGVRGMYHDPYVTYGTIYGHSENIDGPYILDRTDLLVGAAEFNGFSCRTFYWNKRRLLMYTQAERVGAQDGAPATLGSLSTPKELKVIGGRLAAVYSSEIEQRVTNVLIDDKAVPQLDEVPYEMAVRRFGAIGEWQQDGNGVAAISSRSWSVRKCGADAESFIWGAELELLEGRSIGIVFRNTLAVYLDFAEQCVTFTNLPVLQRLESRQLELQHGLKYNVRVVAKGKFFEVYIDDVLKLNFVRYEPALGRFGLFIEAGKGKFSRVHAVSICS